MLKKVYVSVWKHGRRVVEDVVRGVKPSVKFKKDEKLVYQRQNLGLQKQQDCIQHKTWSIRNLSGNPAIERFSAALTRKGTRQLQSGPFAAFSRSFAQRAVSPRTSLLAFIAFNMNIASQNARSEILTINNNDNEEFIAEVQRVVSKAMNSPPEELPVDLSPSGIPSFQYGAMISKGCNAAVYEAKDISDMCDDKIPEIYDRRTEKCPETIQENFISLKEDTEEDSGYNLAVKVMFNLHYESNQPAIERGMAKEILPASEMLVDEKNYWNFWNFGNHPKKKRRRVPPHPNIIEIKGAYIDDMQRFDGCMSEYPDSLPSRLFRNGLGRNKTMYIVMDKYDCTLREYLYGKKADVQESLLLLSQLLEGVLHLHNAKVSHRDLKSDNILIKVETDGSARLVITDFGCCLDGLQIPYNTWEVDKGGNAALMAPEIINAVPNDKSCLNYDKADLWATGTLAYEIFGMDNPFCCNVIGSELHSGSYDDNLLPNFDESVPDYVRNLVQKILKKSPSERPDVLLAANTLQLLLWAPKEWLGGLEDRFQWPSESEIKNWLLFMATEYLLSNDKNSVSNTLKALYFSRLNFDDLKHSLHFLWSLNTGVC